MKKYFNRSWKWAKKKSKEMSLKTVTLRSRPMKFFNSKMKLLSKKRLERNKIRLF